MAVKPNYYETLYVVRPDIKEEELAKIQQKLNEALSAHEGEIIKSDKWAQRELAYEIKKYTRGTYYIIIFKALPGAAAELERHLRFYNTDVLRFMTVKISENAANREKFAAETKERESKAQSEPAEAPVQTEPVQTEPVQTEPVQTEPVQTEGDQ